MIIALPFSSFREAAACLYFLLIVVSALSLTFCHAEPATQNGSPDSSAWIFVFNFRKAPHPLYTSQISRNTVSIFSLSGARTSSFPGIRSLSSRIRDRCRPSATGSTLSVTIIMFGLSVDWATHNKRRIRVQIADTTAPPARTNSYHKIVCPLFRFTLYSPASSTANTASWDVLNFRNF